MGITLSMTGAFRETGASFFFVPKGALTHHLVVASFISLDPPQSGRSRSLRCSSSPHKAGFAGVPCSAVVSFPSVGPCALRGGSRSLRRAPDNAAELAGFGRRCLCGWQTAVASFASSLQIVVPIRDNLPPACENLPPAALSQRWTMPSHIVHFLLYAPKETKTPLWGEERT